MKKGLLVIFAVLFLFSSMAIGAEVQKWVIDNVGEGGHIYRKKSGGAGWNEVFKDTILKSCDTVRVKTRAGTRRENEIVVKLVIEDTTIHCINIATLINEYGAYTYYHIPYKHSENMIEYLPPVFILDGDTIHQSSGGKTKITECGACTTGYHCGLRTPIAEVYVKDATYSGDTVEFQAWYIPSYGWSGSGSKMRVWNYKNSDHPIYAEALIGALTDTVIDAGKACMFYDDGKHSQTAVELAFFEVKGDNRLITLDWKTGSELDNAGFNIYRSTSLDGEYAKLNSELIPASANAFEGASYSYTDKDVQPGLTYYYKLEDLSIEGISTFHGPVSAKVSVSVPSNFALAQNYPNPFNASTMISYDLKADAKVSLKVYNILGQEVTTLVDRYQPAGSYSVTWNGKDSKGNDVSTGVYFYIIKAGDYSANKKMTYLK